MNVWDKRNGWVWDFLELLSEAYKYKFSFRGVQAEQPRFEVTQEEICLTIMQTMIYGVEEAAWRERDE